MATLELILGLIGTILSIILVIIKIYEIFKAKRKFIVFLEDSLKYIHMTNISPTEQILKQYGIKINNLLIPLTKDIT